MPRLVRFYIRHTAIGFLLAAVFVALLLGFNIGNLWHLVTASDVGGLAVFLLVMFNGIVFSGVQFGIAVMRLGEDRTGGPGRGAQLVPIAVRQGADGRPGRASRR